MGTKLTKQTYPSSHGPNDMQCYGPTATKDGDFSSARIADLGCFTQDSKDTNKYYHAAICKSRKNGNWFVYFEWGRTGASNNAFQFVECSDEADAQGEFVSQLMSKNSKRGQWVTIGGIKTLQAKPGKDCYLVRPMATRSVGLPDGKTITMNEGAKAKIENTNKKIAGGPAKKYDQQVISLMQDLNVATVQYARTNLVGGAIPMQSAIDEARHFLTEAQKRVGILGDATIDQQTQDSELRTLTNFVYGRIPKVKPLRAADSTWILSGSNITDWRNDLDAFEAALYAQDSTPAQSEKDPYGGIQMDMNWIDPNSDLGKFLYGWWPKASGNRHSHVGNMKIRNLWEVRRHEDTNKVENWQSKVLGDKVGISDRPLYQPSERGDLSDDLRMKYFKSNTPLLFHGTRTCNVTGILKKSWLLPKQLVGVSMNGAAFGPGSYWADDWRKSDGYTSRSGSYYSSGSGNVQNRKAFMFAADVVLGNPWVCPRAGGYTSPKPGPSGEKTHHIFAKMNKSGVMNNEFITFDSNQCAMRYLCEYDI